MYLNNLGGYKILSKATGVAPETIKDWVKVYSYHGFDALQGGGKSYSAEEKLKVLDHMIKKELSYRETAAFFNIKNHSTIRRWYDKYKAKGVEAFKSEKRGRPKMIKKVKAEKESVEQELERLRVENVYLKKLHTLVQQQNLSKKNSRLKLSHSLKKNLN
jgi:transposase